MSKYSKRFRRWWITCAVALLMSRVVIIGCGGELERVKVSRDKKGFVLDGSKQRFLPWGFNYDHDDEGRLIEDYWHSQWTTVEEDFAEMKNLGANTVRIHLQLGKFMHGPNDPNEASLQQLCRVVELAERLAMYLDITGLGCYHKKDVPAWYDELPEQQRWVVQAKFWEAVAQRCADSPAVFCYDLMNEPTVGGRGERTEWLGPAFAGKHFVQFIALDEGDRTRSAIAVQWTRQLSEAIRRHDKQHLITVGLVPWSLPRKGLTSGFEPKKIAAELDFLCVHLYPEKGKTAEAIETLKGFCAGKPVVIEETFPLKCSAAEFGRFIEESSPYACGWLGFYWGLTPEQCRQRGRIADMLTLGWLEFFAREANRR
ncbi:MAG: cellulase family glycosylhydrolase [Sedimentisphaerales bacterium]|nr:cellulase family glycosylhydrolase [Sedimentisphaerales bacterium]